MKQSSLASMSMFALLLLLKWQLIWNSLLSVLCLYCHPGLLRMSSCGEAVPTMMPQLSTRPMSVCANRPCKPSWHVLHSVCNGWQVYSDCVPSQSPLCCAGARFSFSFVPNARTIQEVSTKQCVTADQSGKYTLSAGQTGPSVWEVFVLCPKVGEVYSILAASNKKYFVLGYNGGRLVDSGLIA